MVNTAAVNNFRVGIGIVDLNSLIEILNRPFLVAEFAAAKTPAIIGPVVIRLQGNGLVIIAQSGLIVF